MSYNPEIKEHIKAYLKELEYRRQSQNTIIDASHRLRYFDMWLEIIDLDWREFNKEYMNQYLNRKKRKRNTIISYMIPIKGLYSFMESEKIIPMNPVSTMRLPKKIRTNPEIFTDKELASILDYWDTQSSYISFRNLLVLYILAGTGIRREELANLRKDAFVFTQTNSNIEIFIKVHGKGHKERVVDLPPVVVGLYLLYHEKYLKDRDDNWVFWSSKNKLMRKDIVYRIVRETCKKVGIPISKAHPHIFRHTYVTNIVREEKLTMEDGIHLRNVMGWANLSSLMYYYQLVPERRKRVTIDRNILTRVSTYQGRLLGKIFSRKKGTDKGTTQKGEIR